jgi:hypothetical protein
MQKIPTLFVRDPENRKMVLPQVTPGCEWAVAGEGTATRKFDGLCVRIEELQSGLYAWVRRSVKDGAEPPERFQPVAHDDATGKTWGWEPATQSGQFKWVAEALANHEADGDVLTEGTYELVGPRQQGNPEGYADHRLVRHGIEIFDYEPFANQGYAADDPILVEAAFAACRAYLQHPEMASIEGIVWHHPDGRMAKLKVRDFPKAES